MGTGRRQYSSAKPHHHGKVWTRFSRARILDVYRLMTLARRLDERMLALLRQGKSFFHIGCAGHEAAQIGAGLAFRAGHDWFYPYYRDLALNLTLGVTPEEVLLNFLAKEEDPSSCGRQMPQHYGHRALRIVSQSSPTGTQYLQAVGTAFANRRLGNDEVVYVSSGEGATSQGDFYEAINWANRDRLPVIFFIQDNTYAISVPRWQQAAGQTVYEMVMGYRGLHRHEVNGLDVWETYQTVKHCVQRARRGEGPSLVVAHTVRLLPHSSSDDQRKYRDADELERERSQDPILLYRRWLLDNGFADEQVLDEIDGQVRDKVDRAVDWALERPDPDPDEVEEHLYGEPIWQGWDFPEPPDDSDEKVVMVDAINHALREELERDERVFVFGEDVADRKGGVFGATRGLSTAFGEDRVFNSPLAESSIIGLAIGAAVRGLKPVPEIQFGDYIWTAMMQIRNELATMRWRSNGNYAAPVVVRVPVGGYIHGALCHSQNIEGFFAHLPGLRIAYPSNAWDAKGLLKTAIRGEDPVLFLEHKGLYRQGFAATPEPGADVLLPFGRAAVRRQGRDLTVITWGMLVYRSLEAARALAEEGIELEVVDIRTINPLDFETIAASVRKTNRALVVHEDSLTAGFGAEIAARIADELFTVLDAPVRRVAALDTPIPFNPKLEARVLPQTADIVAAARELAKF